MHRISIQIREDQYNRLKELSGPGVSISNLIRQALDAYIAQTAVDQAQKGR